MKRTLIAIALGLVLIPSAAWAEDDHTEINLSLGTQFQLVKDDAYDIFSHNDWLAAGSLAAELEVADELFLQVGFAGTTQKARVFERMEASLSYFEPQLTVRKGLTVASWARPYVSLGATYAWTSVTFEQDWMYGGQTWPGELEQKDSWTGGRLGGKAALGCELLMPRFLFHRSGPGPGFFGNFTMGGALEAGWVVKQPMSFDGLKSTEDGKTEDKAGIPQAELDLGELWIQGYYMAFDFRLYF